MILPGTGRGTGRRSRTVEAQAQSLEQPLHHATHGPPLRPGEDRGAS
jgi:hypothetical protein